jgi:hypothetical protein
MNNSYHIAFKSFYGEGTNNPTKLLALKYMLKLAMEMGVWDLQVFGNSPLVVNWILYTQYVHNIYLQGIGSHLKEIAGAFKIFRIVNIFRELKKSLDQLSKEGLQLQEGIICFITSRDNSLIEKREQLQ